MNDCLFCEFLLDNSRIQKVYENEHVFAFLDARPVNPGHTLLVPKNHSRNMLEISEEDACNLARAIPLVARAVKEGVKADGINIHVNNEPSAKQVIFHTHLHIIPRHNGDGLEMFHGKEISKEKQSEVLKEITNAIKK